MDVAVPWLPSETRSRGRPGQESGQPLASRIGDEDHRVLAGRRPWHWGKDAAQQGDLLGNHRLDPGVSYRRGSSQSNSSGLRRDAFHSG